MREATLWRQLGPAVRLTAALTVLLGVAYPALVTGICQAAWPFQANGSLIREQGRIVGSGLIGQQFTEAGYFQPRPSDAGAGYDASNSGGSNLGPTNQELINRVANAVAAFRRANPGYRGPIPADLVTASGSGLDPDISLAAARAQAARVAAARKLPLATVEALITRHAERRRFGFLGEPLVNVLELNLALRARGR